MSCLNTLAVCLLLQAPLPSCSENIVWIEAEHFADCGGWMQDAQFIDQMGSPCLLSVGLGTPVRDAVTRADLPRPGQYRLWARTRDWYPLEHPGRFEIVCNGNPVHRIFGASGGPGWEWEDGGVLELSDQVELRLRDLTGYYGRCDALILSPDLDWKPPADRGAIGVLRQRFGGVSREVAEPEPCDVVVVGGGLAGCTAAVAAARLGCDVTLIQNRPVLGGNASIEILVPPVGVWPHGKQDPWDPRETGLVEEYRTAGNQVVAEGVLYSGRLLRFVEQEPNLKLYLNTHATGVEIAGDSTCVVGRSPDRHTGHAACVESAGESTPSIHAINAIHVRTGQRLRFRGDVFIDCTGDAVIGVAAGAEYRHGKEPQSMYNEPWAPPKASSNTMGNSLKYASEKTDSPQPFQSPPWAMQFPECSDFTPGRHPRLDGPLGSQWKIELGGLRDTYADAESIRDDLLRLIYGLWDHIKNHCPDQKQAALNHRLAWVAHVAGKRENRRLIGDYVLTENDIRRQTRFPDRVAYGGWVLDDHHSAGFFHNGSFGVHYDRPQGLDPCQGLLYSIPYRCLYSKNVANLLMAGRDISASHMALSDTRVMLTCAVIGQAAGTAAAICTDQETTPRGVYQSHIEDLQQQLLKDGAHLIGLPNRDPKDLARQATVTASSVMTRGDGHVMEPAHVINGFARAADGTTNAWCPRPYDDGECWLQLDWKVPQTLNVVHVTFASKLLVPDRFSLQVFEDGCWRTAHDQQNVRFRRYVIGLDTFSTDRLRLSFQGMCGVCEIRVYQEPAHVVAAARRSMATREIPDSDPGFPWLYDITVSELPGVVADAIQLVSQGPPSVSRRR